MFSTRILSTDRQRTLLFLLLSEALEPFWPCTFQGYIRDFSKHSVRYTYTVNRDVQRAQEEMTINRDS